MFLKDKNNFAVGSADKLITARTINGTSFNGTANITTANWGTARNITIGNTTKSVNGSGNVTWSLSEIGAADASKLLPLTGGTLSGKLIITQNSEAIVADSPMQMGYGYLASYGNLKLYADTDATSGANGEYVHIATGSHQPSINSGLAVYRDYATCNNVQFTNGDIVLGNTKALFGKDTNGGSRYLIRMTGSNIVDVGDYNSQTVLLGPVNPTWWNGSDGLALAHSQTKIFEGSNYKFGQGLYGTSDAGIASTTSAVTVQGITAWIKNNNYYAGDGDRFINASTGATQLFLDGYSHKAQVRWSTNTPTADGKITWSAPEKVVSSVYNVTIHDSAPSSPGWGDVWVQI